MLTAAFAISADIEGKSVDSSRRQLLSQIVPRMARPVALMQQQHTRTRFGCCKVARLEDCAVGRLQVDHTRSRQHLRRLSQWRVHSGTLCQRSGPKDEHSKQPEDSQLRHW